MKEIALVATAVNARKVEPQKGKALKARGSSNRHQFFRSISQARYVLRRIFRLIEDEASRAGIDPLAHQALMQVYGAENSTLRVKDLAERLDVSPAFASVLAKSLIDKGYVTRDADTNDKRVAWLTIADAGRELVHTVDEQLQVHVEYFRRTLSAEDRQATLWIIMFYLGLEVDEAHAAVDSAWSFARR